MLSRGDVAIIKAEVDRLEKVRKECTDSGIQERIDVWIKAQKRKLVAGKNSKQPTT